MEAENGKMKSNISHKGGETSANYATLEKYIFVS